MTKSCISAFTLLLVLLFPLLFQAQVALPPEVAKQGYADMIVVNGKIVSMDDAGYNLNPGHIYEAMAVKGSRIMALGTSQQIRSLADAHTQVMDLRGRLVIPGIVESHSHIFGNFALGQQLGVKHPDKGINIRVMAGKDFETTRLSIENGIKNALQKVQPGDWVLVAVQDNTIDDVSTLRVRGWFLDELESRDRMDRLAPENPIVVTAGPRGNMNSKAFETAEKLIPNFTEFAKNEYGEGQKDVLAKVGVVGVSQTTALHWDVWNRNTPVSLTAELIRRDLEQASAHGLTTFSSRIPNPKVLSSFTWLNREGQLPVRFAGLFESHRRPADPDVTRQFYRMTGNLTGLGDDMMWVHGVASEMWDTPSGPCMGPDVEAPPNIKALEVCPSPGDTSWQ